MSDGALAGDPRWRLVGASGIRPEMGWPGRLGFSAAEETWKIGRVLPVLARRAGGPRWPCGAKLKLDNRPTRAVLRAHPTSRSAGLLAPRLYPRGRRGWRAVVPKRARAPHVGDTQWLGAVRSVPARRCKWGPSKGPIRTAIFEPALVPHELCLRCSSLQATSALRPTDLDCGPPLH